MRTVYGLSVAAPWHALPHTLRAHKNKPTASFAFSSASQATRTACGADLLTIVKKPHPTQNQTGPNTREASKPPIVQSLYRVCVRLCRFEYFVYSTAVHQ